MYRLITAIAILMLAACTNPDDSKKALSAAGYTDVEITGYRWFGCGTNDGVQTGFTAIGVDGSQVSGVVCGGLFFKGYTIRVD